MRLKLLIIILYIFSLSPGYAFATPDTTVKTSIPRRIFIDARNTFLTITHTYIQPLHWQKKDFLKLGGVVLLSASAMLIDEEVYRFAQNHQTKTLDAFEKVGDFLGQPEHNYPFMLTLWASGVITNNTWLRDTGVMVIASVSSSGLIQTVAKEAVGRSRPQSGRGAFDFRPFGGADYHSFPSGHTMLSVATSWILARQINFIPLKVVFFSLPVITGASRIYVGAHWLSDILLGSALGIACAESVWRLYPKFKQKYSYAMAVVPTGRGVSIMVKF